MEQLSDMDESALQAYLGKKKYGETGMKALQKAGREGASKETMARIRAKHDKMDEADMEEGNAFTGNLMKARAAGLKKADLDGDGDMETVREADVVGLGEKKKAKPDYIDLDKDGKKYKETMKKAAADKKKPKSHAVLAQHLILKWPNQCLPPKTNIQDMMSKTQATANVIQEKKNLKQKRMMKSVISPRRKVVQLVPSVPLAPKALQAEQVDEDRKILSKRWTQCHSQTKVSMIKKATWPRINYTPWSRLPKNCMES
jgi:hypothetical protein